MPRLFTNICELRKEDYAVYSFLHLEENLNVFGLGLHINWHALLYVKFE